MGIWIRSQNKKRLKFVTDLLLCNIDVPDTESENPFGYKYDHTEINARSNDCETLLGIYSTKERAIEVLDEIHTRLNTHPDCVYLMPAE